MAGLPDGRGMRFPQGTCPVCKRRYGIVKESDGYGRPRADAPGRMPAHAGKRWGRLCGGSGAVCREEAP